jgi:type IX secretion system PorP/SprF family membrane protein
MKNLLFLFLLSGFTASAQQINTSGFYEVYSLLHNPATTGSRQQAFIGGSFKRQWNNIPGSPQTGVIYGQTYLQKARLGLGGYLYHDVTGPTARTGLQMSYAYHIPVAEKSSFSMGLEARLQQLSFDRSKLQAALGGIDPVASSLSNRLKGDAGVGFAYTSPRLQIGAAASQLLQSRYNLYEGVGMRSEQSKLYRHYYLQASYNWQVDEEITIMPNTLITYLPNAPLEMLYGARVVHEKLFWYGLTWRRQQGWLVSAGLTLNQKFSVGYSYDFYKAPLSVYSAGSAGHELLLHYLFR